MPQIVWLPELEWMIYFIEDVQSTSHCIDANLEVLKAEDGRITGIKLTNLRALVTSLVANDEMRSIVRKALEQGGTDGRA